MRSIPLESHYDPGSDILTVWSRQPAEVLSVEPVEGIVLRTDAITDEFVGYTVLNCVDRFRGLSPRRLTLPMVPDEWLVPLREHLATAGLSIDRRSRVATKRRPVRK